MLMIILGLTVFSIVVCFAAFKVFPHKVTWKEATIGCVVQIFVVATLSFGGMFYDGYDTQTINGEVVSKTKDKVSCEHSYDCNCRNVTSCSGSGSSRTCSSRRVCDTCYEHPYDFSWRVHSNVGDYSTISRIDRQGTKEPPRWTSVVVGEPYSYKSSYLNYIKMGKFSLFNKNEFNDETFAVPSFPEIYDYYRIKRVVNVSKFRNTELINNALDEINKVLGPAKKVNVVLVLHDNGSMYMEKLRTKLIGGKINEVIIGAEVSPEGTLKSVKAFSWSKSDMVNVELQHELMNIGNLNDVEKFKKTVYAAVYKHYTRRSIDEFEYLKHDAELPTWMLILVFSFGLLFPFGYSYFAYKKDF